MEAHLFALSHPGGLMGLVAAMRRVETDSTAPIGRDGHPVVDPRPPFEEVPRVPSSALIALDLARERAEVGRPPAQLSRRGSGAQSGLLRRFANRPPRRVRHRASSGPSGSRVTRRPDAAVRLATRRRAICRWRRCDYRCFLGRGSRIKATTMASAQVVVRHLRAAPRFGGAWPPGLVTGWAGDQMEGSGALRRVATV